VLSVTAVDVAISIVLSRKVSITIETLDVLFSDMLRLDVIERLG